ncbi:MAG: GxGYxYP domain-containing protein [Bacillota bacterium]
MSEIIKILLLLLAFTLLFDYIVSGEARAYYPEINSPEELLTIERGNLDDEEYILISSLQGVLAQNQPEIYINAGGSYQIWLDKIKEEQEINVENVEDPYSLLQKFKDQLSGYILTDTDTPALNAATSLAGVRKAVIVCPPLEDEVKDLGLEKIADVRDKNPEWVFENYQDDLNNEIVFTQDPGKLDLRDYIIATRGFVLFETPNSFYKKVYDWLEPDSPRLGWGPEGPENEHVSRASKQGTFTIPADFALNLSTLSGIKRGELEQIIERTELVQKENTISVTEDQEYVSENSGSELKNDKRVIEKDDYWEYELEVVKESVNGYILINGTGELKLEISGDTLFYKTILEQEIEGQEKVYIPRSIINNYDSFHLKFTTSSHLEIENVTTNYEKYVPQKPAEDSETEVTTPDKVHYVAFIMSDGDNVQWLLGDVADNNRYFESTYRGLFPVNWTIAPTLIDLAPVTMEWFYENSIQDYFIAGPSGAGYMYPSEYPDLKEHVASLNEIFSRTDLSYVNIIDTAYINDQDFREAAAVYAAQPNIKGGIYYNYFDYARGDGEIIWEEGKPFVAGREYLWHAGEPDPQVIAENINSYSSDPEDPGAYTVVSINVWDYELKDVYQLVNALDSHVRVVNIDEFFRQVKNNLRRN